MELLAQGQGLQGIDLVAQLTMVLSPVIVVGYWVASRAFRRRDEE